MSDRKFELSRRKALIGLGSVGVASAGAGLGTSAYFSDQEEFENNRLVAGQLDLKMDWEEHYYDESSGSEYVQVLGEGESGDGVEHVFRYPNGDTRRLGVTDLDAFMDATAIEAYPDADDEGFRTISESTIPARTSRTRRKTLIPQQAFGVRTRIPTTLGKKTGIH